MKAKGFLQPPLPYLLPANIRSPERYQEKSFSTRNQLRPFIHPLARKVVHQVKPTWRGEVSPRTCRHCYMHTETRCHCRMLRSFFFLSPSPIDLSRQFRSQQLLTWFGRFGKKKDESCSDGTPQLSRLAVHYSWQSELLSLESLLQLSFPSIHFHFSIDCWSNTHTHPVEAIHYSCGRFFALSSLPRISCFFFLGINGSLLALETVEPETNREWLCHASYLKF